MAEKTNMIPLSLEADSREELSTAMLKNNMQHGYHFKYFNIMKDGKKWIVWYYAIINPLLDNKIIGNE
jgi:hypothetical protein